jgi:hypothetical protein
MKTELIIFIIPPLIPHARGGKSESLHLDGGGGVGVNKIDKNYFTDLVSREFKFANTKIFAFILPI